MAKKKDNALRNAIRNFDDCPMEQVQVPEWGELGKEIYVKGANGDELLKLQTLAMEADDKDVGIAAWLFIVHLVCDKDSNRIFTVDDISWLRKKSGAALQRVINACNRLNGIGDDVLNDIAKNLEAQQT